MLGLGFEDEDQILARGFFSSSFPVLERGPLILGFKQINSYFIDNLTTLCTLGTAAKIIITVRTDIQKTYG
ncbi:hypothetical protein QQP08_009636 [Theobroma cacao]|nr:hypothetical protein QQP08_009636 [Theobroma cacao]